MSEAAPLAQYFLLTTGLGRGQDDATAKKKVCTWSRMYIRLEADGQWCAVNEEEDGMMWFSDFLLLPLPARAVASSQAEYEQAEKRFLAKAKAKRQRAAKAKVFRKQLASGDIYGLRTAVEPEAEPAPIVMLSVAEASLPQQLELVEASLPQPGLLDDFTVIDTEFVPQGQHLLEVAAIRYLNLEPREAFVSFVAFDGRVPSFVTELTGITTLHLHGAPSVQKVLYLLREYIGDSLLVCHNVPADRGVIENTRTRLGKLEPLPNAWLCTMALARRLGKAGLLPKTIKFGLADLCHHFSIKRRGEHRAKADVQMTFQVLRKLIELRPVTKLDLYGAPQPGKAKKNTVPAGPGLFAAA